jgi:hypothetical protein
MDPSAHRRSAVRLRAAGLFVALALMPCVAAMGRDPGSRGAEAERSRLAFVLLREAAMPDAKAVLQAFGKLAPAGSRGLLTAALAAPRAGGVADALAFKLGTQEVMVGLVAAPVPKGEADQHAQFSFAGVRNGWKLPPHRAHLIVFLREPGSVPPIQGVRRFAWLLASVAKAARAEGIYWADSGATHHAGYFAEAAAGESPLAMTILSGLSEASDRGNPERMSLLSLGMAQLGLPDLELSAPRSVPKDDALGFMFDLLSYVLKRGAAIPEGETVGRTEDERLPVRYVPSPVDPKVKVWRVELPER